jgi:hypothetical protein
MISERGFCVLNVFCVSVCASGFRILTSDDLGVSALGFMAALLAADDARISRHRLM